MRVDVISIFPEIFPPVLGVGMTGRALARGLVEVHYTDPRDFTEDKHRTVDDTPYGGGSGMVMLVEPLRKSLAAIEAAHGRGHRILLSPAGAPLRQSEVHRLAKLSHLVLLCGRYEGVDERLTHHVDEEISIGDFILSGGELGALILIDAIARLCPGVLHNHLSTQDESFEHGLLEYPQYTRPASLDGVSVPESLLSGDHERIRRWRRQQSLVRTRSRRPDLFARHVQSKEDALLLAQWDAAQASEPPPGQLMTPTGSSENTAAGPAIEAPAIEKNAGDSNRQEAAP
jgi:tRNA (guanine37-N1)-methyltransferase